MEKSRQGSETLMAVSIILSAFFLLQAHSIEYWANITDWYRGPAFSITLEAVALWLWYRRGKVARSFSVLASVLVIGGAFFQVSSPLYASLQQAAMHEQLIAVTRAEIADHKRTVMQYEDNSGKRPGWAPLIEQVRLDLEASRARLRNQLQQSRIAAIDWRTYAGIALQTLVLLVVMVSQVLAIISIRNAHEARSVTTPVPLLLQEQETERKQNKKQPESPAVSGVTDFDIRVKTLAATIKEQLPSFDSKQRLLAEHLNIRPADISMALNHIPRKEKGKETISESALKRMEKGLGLIRDRDSDLV